MAVASKTAPDSIARSPSHRTANSSFRELSFDVNLREILTQDSADDGMISSAEGDRSVTGEEMKYPQFKAFPAELQCAHEHELKVALHRSELDLLLAEEGIKLKKTPHTLVTDLYFPKNSEGRKAAIRLLMKVLEQGQPELLETIEDYKLDISKVRLRKVKQLGEKTRYFIQGKAKVVVDGELRTLEFPTIPLPISKRAYRKLKPLATDGKLVRDRYALKGVLLLPEGSPVDVKADISIPVGFGRPRRAYRQAGSKKKAASKQAICVFREAFDYEREGITVDIEIANHDRTGRLVDVSRVEKQLRRGHHTLPDFLGVGTDVSQAPHIAAAFKARKLAQGKRLKPRVIRQLKEAGSAAA